MDETITILRRNTKGEPVRQMPAEPTAEGWVKLD